MSQRIQPELYYISLEETENWNFKAEDKACIKKVETVYVFDRRRITFACEITPSFELNPVETRAIFEDSVYKEEESEELRNRIDELVTEEACTEVVYMHCSSIEAKIVLWEETGVQPKNVDRYKTNDKFDPEVHDSFDEWHKELIEDAIEHARGSWVL